LAEGEIALTLGVSMNVSPLPNQELWQTFLDDFAAEDGQVGIVELFARWNTSQQAYFDNSDCVVSDNSLITGLDNSMILDLNPLVLADPDFDAQEYLKGVLSMVEQEDAMWGLPLAAYTEMLWYRSNLFEELGLETPVEAWTIADFSEVVARFTNENPGQPFLSPERGNRNYLLMLMAAYGVLPFDYRTQPPLVNLTNPIVVEGMKQVLDFARQGTIAYQELDSESSSMIISGLATSPLVTASMTDSGFMMPRNLFGATGGFGLTPYPAGNDYTPVLFSLKVGYISASTPHVDGCYRLLKALSKRPDLLNGLPVRDLETVPALTLRDGNQDISTFYERFKEALQRPDVVIMGRDTRFMGFVEEVWLVQAFDAYVLEDADLETVLADVQQKITDYRACTATLPEIELSSFASFNDINEAQQPYLQCVAQNDPALAQRYGLR
jgi:ABC-type glycerol-3-phosphate transport system substrate-binding protein